MIDFSTALKGIDGKALKENGPDGKEREVSLSVVCTNALLMPFPDERNIDGAEKVKRFTLAMKVTDAKKLHLEAEEVAKIKDLVGKAFPPLIVGRAYELLDPKPAK